MTVSMLVLLLLALLSISTAYQLPQFPEPATLTFNYQPVTAGQRLSQSTTTEPPTLSLPSASPSSLYSIVLLDPDAPSAANPVMANWLHYLHSNLPGQQLSSSTPGPLTLHSAPLPPAAPSTLSASYAPPTPPPGSGPHRYVALVYRQSAALPASMVQSLYIERVEDSRRAKWSVAEWERRAVAAGVEVELVGGSYFVVEYGVDGDEASELSVKQDM